MTACFLLYSRCMQCYAHSSRKRKLALLSLPREALGHMFPSPSGYERLAATTASNNAVTHNPKKASAQ